MLPACVGDVIWSPRSNYCVDVESRLLNTCQSWCFTPFLWQQLNRFRTSIATDIQKAIEMFGTFVELTTLNYNQWLIVKNVMSSYKSSDKTVVLVGCIISFCKTTQACWWCEMSKPQSQFLLRQLTVIILGSLLMCLLFTSEGVVVGTLCRLAQLCHQQITAVFWGFFFTKLF